MRGAPAHYDELKKQHGIWLTDTTWKWLQLAAKDSGVSVGEYIESWVRKQVSSFCWGYPSPTWTRWGNCAPSNSPILLK